MFWIAVKAAFQFALKLRNLSGVVGSDKSVGQTPEFLRAEAGIPSPFFWRFLGLDRWHGAGNLHLLGSQVNSISYFIS